MNCGGSIGIADVSSLKSFKNFVQDRGRADTDFSSRLTSPYFFFFILDPWIESSGVMLLVSLLKEKGFGVEIFRGRLEVLKRRIDSYREGPCVVAYSLLSDLAPEYLRLNRSLKKKAHYLSVFGGPHPTVFPEVIYEDGVDVVCRGEGEGAILDLAQRLSEGVSLRNILNLWVKEGETIFKNALRPLISCLDDLPLPSRRQWPGLAPWEREKMHILTGRGCPYSCSFCFNPSYNDLYGGGWAKIRKRSVSEVFKEILSFREEFPLKFIFFDDDVFVLPKGWLREFSARYAGEIGLPFFCQVRADLIDEEVVWLLQQAGCHGVSMGLETAHDETRSRILGKEISLEEYRRAAFLIKAAGIRLKTSNMICIPGVSLREDLKTIALNADLGVDYASANCLAFYPKTKIVQMFSPESLLGASSPVALKHLFSISVAWPFLIRFVPFLVKLPLSAVYKAVSVLCEGYCAYFRLYPAGFGNFFSGLRKYWYRFFKR